MKCRICGNEKDNPEYQVKELQLGLGDEFTYFRCSQCGCLQISEIPGDMSRYYPKTYYSYNTQDKYSKFNLIGRWLQNQRNNYSFFKKGFLGRLLFQKRPTREWFKYLDWDSSMRILDVGCGDGGAIIIMHGAGFRYLTGVDPFINHDIHFNKDFNIYKKRLDELQGEFDVIFLSHSLEHMPDQHLVFESFNRLLSKHGKIIIILPVYCNYMFERFGEYWFALDPPRHFYLHTQKSLELLCKQYNFSITKVFPELAVGIPLKSIEYMNRETGSQTVMSEKEALKLEIELQNQRQSEIYEFVMEKAT